MAQFTLFLKLPPEIRDLIWQLCLPRRVVELDYHYVLDVCWTEHTTWRNGRRPVLAQVCREARRFCDFEGVFKYLHLIPSPDFQLKDDHWHQLYLDSLHLSFRGPFNELYLEDGDLTPIAPAMFGAYRMATPISFCQEFFLDLERPNRRPLIGKADDFYTFAKQTGETFNIVIMTIPIHLQPDEVTTSGLFGHLGDDLVKLVDVHDTALIQKYHSLFRTSSKQSEKLEARFEQILSSDRRSEMLHNWLPSIQNYFLAAQWVALNCQGHGGPDMTTFWHGPAAEMVSAEFLFLQSSMELEQDRLIIPNRDNQLVQDLIAGFPQLIPCVMFRACTYEDCDMRMKRKY
ncbi:hypothetical protein PWT90_09063 [Aphanocladium album]|nr:hypothetical protein PWT90_09063 [Aphanocladium album]